MATSSNSETQALGQQVAEVFLETVSAPVVHAGWLVSVALSIRPEDLARSLSNLWPKDDEAGASEAALAQLSKWPFLVRKDDGWSMLESVAIPLAEHFRQTEPELFRSAHELLAALESEHDAANDLEQGWLLRGRLAFYLAGIDPVESVREFGDAFEHAPVMDRTTCRLWLSNLAIRQSHLLTEQERVVLFFRGFRRYVIGDRRTAAEDFDEVLRSDQRDIYRAIALHLRGVCAVGLSDEEINGLFVESVDLSTKLELPESEIMARHSLTWLRVRQGHLSSADSDVTRYLQEAVSLASLNMDRAVSIQDKGLESWCRRTFAVVKWLTFVGPAHDVPPSDQAREEAATLLRDLNTALTLADATDDPGIALTVLNDRALMYRDLGDIPSALGELEEAGERASALTGARDYVSRLLQTTGSIRALTGNAVDRARIAGLMDKLLGVREQQV
jgi:tetratricopeptide (TPR) repeat protein